jgi:hypothetical protein
MIDAIVGWLVATVGDHGLRLVKGSAEERVLRRALSRTIDSVVRQELVDSQDALRAGLEICFSGPPSASDHSTGSVMGDLRAAVTERLALLGQLVDSRTGRPFYGDVQVEPDVLVDRVTDAFVQALRQTAIESGPEGLLHALESEEMRGLIDGLARDLPEATRTAVQKAVAHEAADGLLIDPARRWELDRFPPSALLRAEYAVVPFHGRDGLLADIGDWASSPVSCAMTLWTGAGGMGKTRLMMEAVQRFRDAGWRAGFLAPHVREVSAAQLVTLGEGAAGVAVVIDYAETRTSVVHSLCRTALATGAVTRLILLARAAAGWWYELRRTSGPVGDFLNGPAVTRRELSPLTAGCASRAEEFRLAARSYADVLGVPVPAEAENLSASYYDRVLFLHMRALAATQGSDVQGEGGLLDYLLRRESAFWDAGVQDSGLGLLAGRPVHQAAALATLTGGATGRAEAIELLAQAPLLGGQPAAVVSKLAELLHRLYPAPTWLAGVQPDLLGEHLVGRAIEDDPMLLGVFGGP